MHEVDGVLLYQNFLFDVEVKAGKADPDSVLADPKKAIDSYRAIVEGGIRECDSFSAFCEAHKTIDIRASNGKIKKSVPKERIKAIVPIVIFYEEMGCFLPGFTSTEGPAGKQRPTLLNVFDFLTIIDYLQSPLLATKYLYERSYPTVCDRLSFDDELPFLSIFTKETVNLAVFLSKMKEKVESFPEATQAHLDDGNLSRDIEKYYMNLKKTRKPDFHFPKLVELLLKNEDAFDAEFFDLAFDLLGNEPEDLDRIYSFYFKANSGSKNVPQLLRPSSKKENEEGIVLAKRPSSPYDKKLLLSFLAFYFNRYPELTALNVIKIRREEASFERITKADSAINDPGVQEESKKLILLMEDTEI